MANFGKAIDALNIVIWQINVTRITALPGMPVDPNRDVITELRVF